MKEPAPRYLGALARAADLAGSGAHTEARPRQRSRFEPEGDDVGTGGLPVFQEETEPDTAVTTAGVGLGSAAPTAMLPAGSIAPVLATARTSVTIGPAEADPHPVHLVPPIAPPSATVTGSHATATVVPEPAVLATASPARPLPERATAPAAVAPPVGPAIDGAGRYGGAAPTGVDRVDDHPVRPVTAARPAPEPDDVAPRAAPAIGREPAGNPDTGRGPTAPDAAATDEGHVLVAALQPIVVEIGRVEVRIDSGHAAPSTPARAAPPRTGPTLVEYLSGRPGSEGRSR